MNSTQPYGKVEYLFQQNNMGRKEQERRMKEPENSSCYVDGLESRG